MAQLAIAGGNVVRSVDKHWPQWPVSSEQDAALVADITRSNRWSYDGPHEWRFAEAFTKYQNANFGLCCSNGTVGLQLALEALGIGAYDEVIVPGMTWQATAAAVCDVNAVPVLVDVESDTWNISLDAVEAAITERTRAITVVHLYGCMTDLDRLQPICRKHNLYLIDDSAHQHGSFWNGQGVGSFGDISSWSFQESKVIASGEGGFNMCKTEALFYRLYSLRNCGRPYEADPPVFGLDKPALDSTTMQSGNYRLTEWQAALLLGGLERLDVQVKLRDENATYLGHRLAEIPGIMPMRRRGEITQQSYFNFAFRLDAEALGVENRAFSDALNAELSSEELFEPPYAPLNRCPLYKPLTKARHHLSKDYFNAIDPARFALPVCEDAYDRSGVVAHHRILMGKQSDMDDIADAVKKLVDNIDAVRELKSTPGWRNKALG